jgi:hypothetical protein
MGWNGMGSLMSETSSSHLIFNLWMNMRDKLIPYNIWLDGHKWTSCYNHILI